MRMFLQIVLFGVIVQANASAQIEADARYRHIFPQVADGLFDDGTSYATSFVVTNTTVAWVHCYIQLEGLGDRRLKDRSFWIYGSGVRVTGTRNRDDFDHGYAVMECSQQVTAHATYERIDASGEVLSMAMVPSSPRIGFGHHFVTQAEGKRTALAIVNDALQTSRYEFTLYDDRGRIRDYRIFDIGPAGYITKFADELLRVPGGDFSGTLEVSGAHFHSIGMLFDGEVFTTIPVTGY